MKPWPHIPGLLLVLPLAAGLASAQAAAPRSIRVAMDNNYPPFAFSNSKGGLQGILVDQWRLWEKQTGIEVELVGMDWSEALWRMRAGEFDVIDTIFKTGERTDYLDFTEPYVRINVLIFFRKEISGISDLNSLKGFPVAVKSGDAAADVLRGSGISTLQDFTNYETIVQAAKEHKVNVFMMDEPPAIYFLNKLGLQNDFRKSPPVSVGAFHRAVRKGNLALLKAVEGGFASISATDMRQVTEKWYGRPVGPQFGLRHLGYMAVAALLLVLGLVVWNLLLNRLVGRRTAALQQSESRLRALLDHIPDWVWLKDPQSRYITANMPYTQAVGRSLEALSGRNDAEVWPEANIRQSMADDEGVVLSGEPKRVTEQMNDANGRVRWLETVKAPVRNAAGKIMGTVGIARDITERKQAEAELRRTNRTLRLISECSQLLVRANNETELLRAICRLAVEAGGYRMAWVGFVEQDEAKSVRPVAQAGFEQGYLDTVKITWADTERGQGPTGMAIRTRQAVVARNILTDPAFAPWRKAALERGYAASAALPLIRGERVLGALMVYAAEPETFDAGEVELLTQLAADLSYGITALRTRLEEERVEEELHRLSAHLLQVRDVERRRLARELHDTTAQHLAALTLNLANLKGRLAGASGHAETLCRECSQLANRAAQEIRTHAYLLHPPLLEIMGLVGAVEEYAQGFSARSGIAVEVTAPADFGRLPEDMEVALFRVIQEGLANVLRHSQSARAKIGFKRSASSVILEVQDMGRGIPADKLARLKTMTGGSGVGLGGMQERLRLLGGRLELESTPAGTTVRATVPLPNPSPPSAAPAQ